MGMKCPICGNRQTFTRGTSSRMEYFEGKEVPLTRRQRWCPKCLKWHVTIEIRECEKITWMPEFGFYSMQEKLHG